MLLADGDGRAPERRRLLHRHPRCRVGRVEGRRTASSRRSPRSAGPPSGPRGRGARILVISDRAADERRAPIPMLLAIGAVRQHLVHTGPPRPGRAWSPRRATRSTSITSPPSSATARRRCTPGSRSRASRTSSARSESRRGASGSEPAEPRPAPAEARAAVPRRRGEGPAQDPLEDGDLDALARTAARRSSRCSGLGHEVDRLLLRGHRVAASAASASRKSPRTCWRGIARPIATAEEAPALAARPRPGALPQGRRGPRLGAADRGGAAAGGEERTATRGLRRLPGEERRPPPGRPARPAGGAPGHAGAARRGGAGGGDPAPLHLLGDVARRAVAGGARHALDRDEPDGRPLQLRRRRRGPAQLPRLEQRRPGRQPHQAGGLGPVRRHHRVPGPRRGAGDQDRAGRQARRGRPAARRTR